MSAPRILLIDEPSVGLAPLLVARTIDKIKELKEGYQLTVLMAEQNFTQAIRIADRGYVIVHGRIEFEGASAAELNNNELIREFYLRARESPQGLQTFSGAGGARPRMRSAAFSAIMMTAALILPPTRSGITDASTTRSASTPRTRSVPSTTAISSDFGAHPASAKRVMRGDGGGADMRVECRVRPAIRSRRDFGCGEGPKRRLPADVTCQAKTRSQRRGITVGRKEVLHDPHWSAGIG